MLPEFLSDHYNFIPKYTGVKQEIDTKSLIELSHRFNDNLFNTYYEFLTNFSLMEHRKNPKPLLNTLGVSFASTMIANGSALVYNLSGSNISGSTLNIDICVGLNNIRNNKHVLLFAIDYCDSDSYCGLNEINLYYLKEKDINVKTDDKKHYYLLPPSDKNEWNISLDTSNSNVQKALGIPHR